MRKRMMFIAVLIFTIGMSVFTAVEDFNASYEGYLSGEYYFRYPGETITINNGLTSGNTESADPDNVLYYTSGANVRACDNDHDGLCEVCYDYKTYQNFPAGRLVINSEDIPYFNGSKVYTRKEYHEKLMSLDGFDLMDGALSDPSAMKSYKSSVNLLKLLLVFNSLGLAGLFCIKHFGRDDTTEAAYKLVAYIVFFINVGWNSISAFLLMF